MKKIFFAWRIFATVSQKHNLMASESKNISYHNTLKVKQLYQNYSFCVRPISCVGIKITRSPQREESEAKYSLLLLLGKDKLHSPEFLQHGDNMLTTSNIWIFFCLSQRAQMNIKINGARSYYSRQLISRVFFNWKAVAKAANWERMIEKNAKPQATKEKRKSIPKSDSLYSIEASPAYSSYSSFTPLSARSQSTITPMDKPIRTKSLVSQKFSEVLLINFQLPSTEKKLSNYGSSLSSLKDFARLNREKIASRSSSRSSPKATPVSSAKSPSSSSFVRPKEKHRELLLAIEQDKLRRIQMLRNKE